jgi:hypothetical protein
LGLLKLQVAYLFAECADGSDDGTQEEHLCKELGVIKVMIEITGNLVIRPLGYHPKIETHQTYDLESIEPLKIHSAE